MEKTTGFTIKVKDCIAGDLFYHPLVGHRIYVCRGPHPIWLHLSAVVWCDEQGNLSIDALNYNQELSGVVVNRNEFLTERALRFRNWYLEKKK